MAPTIAVAGATGTGLVYQLARLPADGETVLTDTLAVVPGGKASNHALGIVRLGGRARLLSALGDDPFGRRSREIWRRHGVDAAGVVELAGIPSLIGSVLVDGAGANRIVVATGAMGRYRPADVAAHADRIESADALLVSLEMPAAPAVAALRIARAAGVPAVLNPAPAPAPEEVAALLAEADWLTPNQPEAAALTGCDDPAEAAAQLLDRGVRGVAITLGPAGVLLATTAGGMHRVPAVPVPAGQVVDTSGAGDAFNAAFVLSLAGGAAPVAAVECGCAAGARIVQGPDFYTSLGLLDGLDLARP